MGNGGRNKYAKETYNASNMAMSEARKASPQEVLLGKESENYFNWANKAGRDVGELSGIGAQIGLYSKAKERAQRQRQGIGAFALGDSANSQASNYFRTMTQSQDAQDYAGALENVVGMRRQEALGTALNVASMDANRKAQLLNASVSRENIYNQQQQGSGALAAGISGGLGVLGAALPLLASDERLKEEIEDLPYGLDAVKKLRPKRYRMNGKEQVGFLAQDVEKVVPEVTDTTADGTKGIYYQNMIPLLASAIQDLKSELDSVTKSKKA
jgi:hypothetical protein